MWMMMSETQRWIWADGQVTQVGEVVELFLDFDPVGPDWPPGDAKAGLENGEPPQKEGSDARQDRH